ncbi:SAM-dependent methyltransferase [Rhodococcus sp. 06-412-2C]|uniref:THUMP-like domain-containing protein n=1 Tax=unclassified Rhodococcus (in: high G+C Gram-positive bacteria) TaxID=192944 RepID=UPI000B9BFAC8|nr:MULTISPECIES: SAM-dependent methyltransferase [unclassified Rhodococcus (in: high G+C Gram-positive bacteria)]OZC82255.1 SAM-dependent methyltransferase [Rhodococcus sp. 06-412-2C]OZC95190.1 SAM-dependent methyltransferase [Rhodococcus sp. 06-412-2B]
MGYEFTGTDLDFLRSEAGAGALAAVDHLELNARTSVRDTASVRTRFPDHASALIETVTVRRKARVKLFESDHWLVTDDAVQQATPTLVARRRAERLAGRRVHDVTCSIGSELAVLVGSAELAVGSDLDPIRLRMAAHNVPAATLLRADALTPTTRGTVVVADPGRRAGGRRRHDPAALQPPLPDLFDAYRGRDLVVKCAPGLDFDAVDWPGEIEVVSLDGGVREACLWSEGLSERGIRRRAAVLRSDGSALDITDAESDDIPVRPPGRYIVDPDGAVVRAGLVRHYGARFGLWQLDPRIAYLTGDTVPAGVRGFRVLEQSKFSEKVLRQQLNRMDCGSVEILVRGVDVDPALLRPKLKLRGTVALSVVITRIDRSAVSFVCAPGAIDQPV